LTSSELNASAFEKINLAPIFSLSAHILIADSGKERERAKGRERKRDADWATRA